MDINHATPEMTCLHRHSLDSTFILLVICGSIGLSAQQSGDPTVQSRTNITGEKPKFVFPDLIRKTKKELRAGDKFELTCEAIGKPTPIVTWYKDGKIYERFHDGQKPGPHDYQLEFNGLDIADSGSYMCNVSNELGFLTLTYNLTVQDLIRSQPNILIIWEQKSPIYVGQNVEIFCTIVTKDPNTKYHWYHSDTNTIPNDENLGVLIDPRLYEQPAYNGGDEKLAHVKFTLTLQNVTIDQSGLYGCQAENRIGYESRQTNLTVTHRSIIIPPVFADTSAGALTELPTGHSVMLKCKADGAAPLKYTWLKDGKILRGRTLDPYLNTSIWYLKLKDLVPGDAGEYTCIVSNPYGSINHTYSVRVQGEYRRG
ncbi:fibroblast growth factor receptor 3-like isoform X2 [Porites lutea]|uniref:fibroblast growth factor receptor 3-like isoform X2 n=1 Tax=Porites lutea TaxID=51062 RepID=UPI003CC69FA2